MSTLPQQITELVCSKIVLTTPLSYGEQVPSTEFNNLHNSFVKVICSVFGATAAIDASSFQFPCQDDWIPEIQNMREITQQWPDLTAIHLHIDIFYRRFQQFIDWIHDNPNTNDYISDYKVQLLNIVHDTES